MHYTWFTHAILYCFCFFILSVFCFWFFEKIHRLLIKIQKTKSRRSSRRFLFLFFFLSLDDVKYVCVELTRIKCACHVRRNKYFWEKKIWNKLNEMKIWMKYNLLILQWSFSCETLQKSKNQWKDIDFNIARTFTVISFQLLTYVLSVHYLMWEYVKLRVILCNDCITFCMYHWLFSLSPQQQNKKSRHSLKKLWSSQVWIFAQNRQYQQLSEHNEMWIMH